MPLDVVIVNTDSDGFLSREELRVDAVFDQTLRESLKAATPMLKESTEYGGTTTEPLVCYEGNNKVAIYSYNDFITKISWNLKLESTHIMLLHNFTTKHLFVHAG